MNILGKNNTRINFKKSDSQNKEFAFMKAHELNNIEKLIKVKCDFCNGIGERQHYNKGECGEVCPRCKGYGHYFTKNIWRTGSFNQQKMTEHRYFDMGGGKKWTVEHNVGRKSTKQTTHNTMKGAFNEARKVRKGKGWKGYGFLG